jgi:hypothetical protein
MDFVVIVDNVEEVVKNLKPPDQNWSIQFQVILSAPASSERSS